MGAFAFKAMPEDFHWIDVEKEPAPNDKIKTFWSHGGLDGCEPGHEAEPKPRQLIEGWLKPAKAKPAPKISTGTGIDHDAVNAALGLNADRSNYGRGILPNPFASQCKEWARRKAHAATIALITEKIEALFEPRFITPPETAGFIEALITMSDARRVLEVGTHTAFGTLHMLRAIIGKEGAGLVSIDSRPTHDRAFFALPQIAPWFTHVAGSTPEVLKKLHGSYFDLVFVDSDHSVEHCEKERLALMEITKPGSIWLFHDVPRWQSPTNRTPPPVVGWLDKLVQEGFFKGLVLPTCEQLDCLAMWGPGYPPQCNPHLGCFIRQ
jgi:predicted O-methyltransferase YrrM